MLAPSLLPIRRSNMLPPKMNKIGDVESVHVVDVSSVFGLLVLFNYIANDIEFPIYIRVFPLHLQYSIKATVTAPPSSTCPFRIQQSMPSACSNALNIGPGVGSNLHISGFEVVVVAADVVVAVVDVVLDVELRVVEVSVEGVLDVEGLAEVVLGA